jgi:hypothetical protein
MISKCLANVFAETTIRRRGKKTCKIEIEKKEGNKQTKGK